MPACGGACDQGATQCEARKTGSLGMESLMKRGQKIQVSRRRFVKTGVATAAALGFPAIVPSSVFGQYSPSKRINVGAIGTGRISRVHDMPSILQYDNARIVAVCDLDAHRVEDAKKFVNDYYAK